ncbi:MAG: MG2 domain-containing protein [Caldilineaceae bacterium]
MQQRSFWRQRRTLLWARLLLCLLAGVGAWSALPTRAQWQRMNFGYGRGLQIVDPAGHNQIPFWFYDGAGQTVKFTLYRLTTPDFLSRYAVYDPYNPSLQHSAGLTPAAQWQQTLAAGDPYALRPVTLPTTTTVTSGLYLIRAENPTTEAATSLLVVGRTVLVLKRGAGGQVVAWASYLHTDTPAAGMTITLYDQAGNRLTQAVTDADGLATLAVGDALPWLAIGVLGEETTVAGLDWQWRSDGSYYWYDTTPAAYRIYLYTDRPIYRPGHTINYQAFLRNNLTSGYTPLSAGTPVTVTLRDSRSNVVATIAKTVDAYGALDGAFVLGDEPPLGQYQVEVNVGGQTQSQALQVEEYRKPEYAVEVQTPADFAVMGDKIPVTVAADYFFGQPVGSAAVKLQIYRQRIYRYSYWWWYEYGAYGRELVTELTSQTDGQGRWQTDFTPEATSDYDVRYTLVATVTDAREQPVTGEQSVNVHWNTFTLQASTPQYGYRAGEAVTVNLSARDHGEQPVAGQVVKVRIIRHYWDDQSETDAVTPQETTTNAQGAAQLTFTNVPQGWYRIVATSTDARGRTVTGYNYLWVYDPQSDVWWYTNSDQISITADRDSYAPGDTAHLLIQSRVTGLALLTLERAGVHEEKLVPITGPMTTVDVPITDDFAPNIFAQIHLFQRTEVFGDQGSGQPREGQLLTAQTELQVPATDKRLTVTINADATSYLPGAPATLTLQVTDAAGQPVQARLGVALVDEAIFALQEELAADLFDAFYGAAGNSVATYDSLVRRPFDYYWGPLTDDGATPTIEGTPTPSSPAEEGGALTGTTAPRRTFLDTAYWNAQITTDATGKATLTVPLPDNLTTWRVIVRAITVDTQVGETRAKVLVTKEIVARPVLPRFGVVGDRFQSGVVAQNFSGSATDGTATQSATNLLLLDPGTRALTLPDGGSAVGKWTAVAAQVGTGLITTTVQTGAGQDVVELPFAIKPFAAPVRWSAAGQAAPTVTETFTVPFNAVNDASSLSVRLAPSLALGLLDGLDELIDYPYGCVEQTMSRVLPSAVAAKVYADLALPNPKADELPAIISQGLQKLYGFQHEDGSWGWFYDDDGGLYLTAYVLFGLTSVQQAGFTVDADVINAGFDYLDSRLNMATDAGAKAYAHYVKTVAGRGDRAQSQALISQTATMDAAAVAALALALHLNGDDANAQQVIDQLLSRASELPITAFWPLADTEWRWYHWQTMASTEKNTALAVRALVALRPNHPLLPKAIRWLMDHRRGAGWNNTQATAFAVLGLADYMGHTNELQADYTYEVLLNNTAIANGAVTPATVRQPIAPLTIAGADLRMGENQLTVRRSDAATPLYYTLLLRQQLFYDEFTPVTSADQGLAITRAYKLVDGIVRKDGAYSVGNVVEVTLGVEVREEMAYLLVEDPIPAGFEALQERINPVAYPGEYVDFFWPYWGYNRKNVRDDRVDFFLTYAWAGKHTLTYLMRATTPGEFSVLPGQAYPMYNEDIWGRSASQLVQVAPEALAARPTLAGDFDRDCRITDFDARQVAGAWGTQASKRNLVGDTQIDLADVAAVMQRVGAKCGADRSRPTQGEGVAQFTVTAPDAPVQIGEHFTVRVTFAAASASQNAATQPGGWGLSLAYDPARLAVVDVAWSQQAANVLPLGPHVDNSAGRVQLGAYGVTTTPAGEPQAIITFVGRSVGPVALRVTGSEAVNRAGELIGTTVESSGNIKVDGQELFLPVVVR